MLTDQERFDRKWKKNPSTGCHIWTKGLNPNGYGVFGVNGGNSLAHRYSFEKSFGPIPVGHVILHSCDNRRCVNPDHLSSGTHAENMADMARKGRAAKPVGEANSRCKISRKEADVIMSLKGVLIQKDIAELFEISKDLVTAIHCGKAWAR